ncbi:GntR family transcriptional regulator [Paraburkholderia sp. J67]|uniref:GntR family transcriptional regulator n=1 Tax=Paraburkholderia sp. J67 TaxID=2805435 RepID=UPI002ABDD61C|nr:GntR family transcriptional regulator [Paraburkholderia sp. J67]
MIRKIAIERPRSLSGVVTERLRDAIMTGELALGEALSEDTLATELGVSRTPIREALSTLQYQGLVTIVPQTGTFVFTATATDVGELCEFRATLEVKAARLAMARHQEAALASLNAAVAEMAQAQKKKDSRAYARADTQFHAAFLDHCDNPYLKSAYLLASGRVSALRTHLAGHVEGEPQRSFDDHHEIIALWKKGDIDRIESVLVQHIMRTQANYLRAVESGQIPAGAPDGSGAPALRKRRPRQATPA